MPEVRGKERIAQRFRAGIQAGVQNYRDGVARPRRDWQSSTLAAQDAYETAIQQAIAEKRFGKGVSEVSTTEWQRAASTKGARNFGPGAAAAAEKYQRNVMPYLQIIEQIEIGERIPGDVRGNIERRLVPIAEALHEAKRK